MCHTLGIYYEVLPGHQMETFEIPHIFMPSLQVLSERATRTSFIDSLMVKPQKSDMKNSNSVPGFSQINSFSILGKIIDLFIVDKLHIGCQKFTIDDEARDE